MSMQIRTGSFHAAVIPARQHRRVVLRTWRANDSERTGFWVLVGFCPLRLITGREVSAVELG
ncbi:hypothetical protein GCM10025781_26380 [Kocuria gwangalliensis]|uniref:Uncharacterized protein n=1 Tax=Kocuria gwangalliensis TaxID=501592 RepID=A0ABP8XGT1_9MICC